MYSEYFKFLDSRIADALATKKHAAPKAAEAVRATAAEKAQLRRENKILRELHRYYENVFPWLIDFKGEELDDLIREVNSAKPTDDEEESVLRDPATEWLSAAEFNSSTISQAEKYQRALDRYWMRRKTPWQIGRDYERYVGYVYEQAGYKVEYHGIFYGYEDLGRDLICKKGDDVRVIQCKYWRNDRTVHEKHICQLVGTGIVYDRQCKSEPSLFGCPSITSWLYTSTILSDKAIEFARLLDVQVVQNFPLERYPLIKCNVSHRDGSKIYHLPFDQQYDRTLIEFEDEHYVQTVAEAEALGFRRAFRWRGNESKLRSG